MRTTKICLQWGWPEVYVINFVEGGIPGRGRGVAEPADHGQIMEFELEINGVVRIDRPWREDHGTGGAGSGVAWMVGRDQLRGRKRAEVCRSTN